METVSQPLLPPHRLPGVHPHHCSPLLSSLVSMQTLPWSRSPVRRSSATPHTHLQAQVEGRRSSHLLVEEARQPTDGRQRRGRSSRLGQEFWRERETKDEEGTKRGGRGGCMWGLKKGRRRLTECSDTS